MPHGSAHLTIYARCILRYIYEKVMSLKRTVLFRCWRIGVLNKHVKILSLLYRYIQNRAGILQGKKTLLYYGAFFPFSLICYFDCINFRFDLSEGCIIILFSLIRWWNFNFSCMCGEFFFHKICRYMRGTAHNDNYGSG